jgi:cytochrome c-type biogenesis protein
MGDVHIYLGVALAGLLSFLSPCVLPLVPPYLSYIGGTTIEELTDEGGISHDVWRRVVLSALCFVLGFTTVFLLLGASASALGQVIQAWRGELAVVAGIVIILFGLHFLGLLPINLLYREARYHHRHDSDGVSFLGAYVIGVAFAFGWTPCVGPILTAVLALAAREGTLVGGMKLLFVYSMGLGVPFMLAALAVGRFLAMLRRFRSQLGRVEKAMGAVLVITGILFLTGSMNGLGQWMLETFPWLATIEDSVVPHDLQGAILKKAAGQ